MTPDDLALILAPLHLAHDAPELVAEVEARADAAPGDPSLRAALLAVHAHATAPAGLRPVVAGVRREVLVRWDAHTTTWLGVRTDDGTPAMVRALRPEPARDPLLRRQLHRERRALSAVLPVLESDDALVLPLPGPPFRSSPAGGRAGEDAFVRLVARTLHALARWEQAGLGVPLVTDPELRDAGDHLVLTTLTVPATSEAPRALQRVGAGLRGWWSGDPDHPMATLLDGLVAVPPERVGDAVTRCVAAMAELLAGERHVLVRHRRAVERVRRHERLEQAVAALDAAVPPPVGFAALGVDMDGSTLVVRSDGETVSWGRSGGEEPLYDPEDGFDVPSARRLVRTRGIAPVSGRLNREIGGDPMFAEAIARWVAAALELRTIRKLLEAELAR